MNITFPLLSAAIGAVTGWTALKVVDSRTKRKGTTAETLLMVAATAGTLALLALRTGRPDLRWIVYGALIPVLAGVTLFDVRTKLIPHMITIPGTIVGLIAGTYILPLGLLESFLGLAVG